eukprot:TRINITY_DN4277_c0_g1_i2.p1 TRINITY_DN4277_c0_g1~~TRINITY_DN4277_c0_g1_i2.p1  ORF type:complete len:276 (+),score=18.43 TRINITY_DN4277_c0_g1_i2:244-1071(+)
MFKTSLLALCCMLSVTNGLKINYRKKTISRTGREEWMYQQEVENINPAQHAVIIVDMWNQHWCPSATSRVAALAGPMNKTVGLMRNYGYQVIWAPSQVTGFYNNTKVRERTLALPNVTVPEPVFKEVPPFPINATTDGGCDVPAPQGSPWKRQISTLTIDGDKDFLITAEDGPAQQELWNILVAKNITNLIYMGVHENMCIMNRPFAIEQVTARGFKPSQISVVREHVDVMYTPYDPPYVPHKVGVRMQTDYIEQFWGRSFSVYDILTPSYNITV